MLRRLRDKAAAAGLSSVEVAQAGFSTYRHQGDPADFVYSRYALHLLPDFCKVVALDRAYRILRLGGILRLWDIVYDFQPVEAWQRLEALVLQGWR